MTCQLTIVRKRKLPAPKRLCPYRRLPERGTHLPIRLARVALSTRFDSPSAFAALLDTSEGGRYYIRPVGEYSSERRYLANTNVLETVFRTPTGACVLRDLMSVSSEEDKRAYLTPEHEVLRQLEGLEEKSR